MRRIKENFIKLQQQDRRKNIIILTLLICILLISLFFLPDISPLFRQNTISVIKSIQKNIHNTIPVTHFKNKSNKNETIVIDKPIQSTGCNTPLTLKTKSSNYVQITDGKEGRKFIIYLPAGYKNNTQHPLIMAFHGYASDAFSLEKFTHFDDIANNNNVILIYPEGTTSLVKLQGWNTGLHPTITSNDVLFVSNMLNEIQSNLCVNPHQIYATGFSNGGGFVAKLACQLSNRVAAFSSVSGSYVTAFKTCRALRSLPIMEIHGTKDTTVPYVGLEAKNEFAAFTWANRWAARDKCKPKPIITVENKKLNEYQWTNCDGNSSVVHYKIIGEGHSWPHIAFNERINNTIHQVNAAHIIWDFFSHHPLPKNVVESPDTKSI
ncbi:MAG TPA: PHB depolymerase family esterase [Candidatus Saccharimonadales bacterium]|nr:PHB depolymerase family esterase [Candidatus Saccharimonadales bacterium]